jgi:hypothetical protein
MDVEKNRGRMFRRPKLTLSCSAKGKKKFNATLFLLLTASYVTGVKPDLR